jgi:hypothetical protein
MGRKKTVNYDVVKFFPVISLKSVYGAAELGGDIDVKRSEGGSNVRLFANWKSPNKMRVIIEKNKIIQKPRITRNRRGPYITVN